MNEPEILIVGAGPTGLVLALSLAHRGVPFRLIDAAGGPGEHSRATAVHARTLEFYRQLGFADEVVGEGIPSRSLHLRRRSSTGESVKIMDVGFEQAGRGLSPFPYILTYPQDVHERLLVRRLQSRGIAVERNTILAGLGQDATGVTAHIVGPDGQTRSSRFSYVCGCDGAHSNVRAALGLTLAGGTYDQPFYVADVKLAADPGTDITINLGHRLLALMMPVRVTGTHRLIGLVPPALQAREDLTFAEIQREVEDLVGAKVAEVNWFSRYRVHHRVANRFQSGRAFLLGDAGHIHSPVGGQGMNTGIGDAINLGWKLAAVASGKADPTLLESYEAERIGFARALVATTDTLFSQLISGGAKGTVIRRVGVTLVGFLLSNSAAMRTLAFKTVSQIRVRYRHSPLSRGKAGRITGGDRLPWVPLGTTDNFAPLQSLDWQVHVYGDAAKDLGAALAPLGVPLHRFPWNDAAKRAGLERDAVYAVRPDGYVGYAGRGDRPQDLVAYLGTFAVKVRGSDARP